MRVILLKDVRNVGRKDEIKEVADGFANNFLLRQNLAVPASIDRVAAIEKRQTEDAASRAAQDAKFDDAVRALAGARIETTARTTQKGGLFKAITAGDIIRAIKEQKSADLPETAVELNQPIKVTGEHSIRLQSKNAHADIVFVITAVE